MNRELKSVYVIYAHEPGPTDTIYTRFTTSKRSAEIRIRHGKNDGRKFADFEIKETPMVGLEPTATNLKG